METIVVSQPASKKWNLSNEEPLTDEYLNSVLPSVGFKIIPPPTGYVPIQPKPRHDPRLPRVPKEFLALFTDLRPDDELTDEERKERHVMKLLMQIKEGNALQKKFAMRKITSTTDDGVDLVLSKILPLISSDILDEQERHSLTKALNRVTSRLSGSVDKYVPDLLDFAGSMILDSHEVVRREAKDTLRNLAKVSGMVPILNAVRGKLDDDDKQVRETVARILAVVTLAVGIPNMLHFIHAAIGTRKSWKIREVGVRLIDCIAQEAGNEILPFLRDFADIIQIVLDDEEGKVVSTAAKCVVTLAKSAAPFGGEAFEKILPILWERIGTRPIYLNAVVAVLGNMEQTVATRNLRQLAKRTIGDNYANLTTGGKLVRVEILCSVLQREAYDKKLLNKIDNVLFSELWSYRTILEHKVARKVLELTVEFTKRSSFVQVTDRLFSKFKGSPVTYRDLVLQWLNTVIDGQRTTLLPNDRLSMIIDNLLFALKGIEDRDDKSERFVMRVLENFVLSIGNRVSIVLEDVGNDIAEMFRVPNHAIRREAAQLISIFASAFSAHRHSTLLYFYNILQEFLAEEYPDVLAAVISAIDIIIRLLSVDEMKPPPTDVAARLVPILKNRHPRVSYSCVSLATTLAVKTPDAVPKKEWMRICFELLELLKADRRKVRMGAVNAFSYIADAIGPFDILLALLNNLRVQERHIRLCTTSAIAILASHCGPHLVLPILMNEYRIPDGNVQHATLKAIQFLFQEIGPRCSEYAYAVAPLLGHALTERDPIHRQLACIAVKNFALGCFAAGKEDVLIHIMNHVMPNIFEPTLRFIDAVMDCIDALRVAIGPGIVLQYLLAGLFHPARKVRSQYWRAYNALVIYGGDSLVPYYPNTYPREELEVFI